MTLLRVLFLLMTLAAPEVAAQSQSGPQVSAQSSRVKEAADLILKLCIAGGSDSIEISPEEDSLKVTGKGSSVTIDRRDWSGLVGGISKEITVLSAQQASEARNCTQKYLGDILNFLLKDDPNSKASTPRSGAVAGTKALFNSDPDSYWDGKGIWQDPENYCEILLSFLSASSSGRNFRFAESGKPISPEKVTTQAQMIEGNFFVKTDPGSTEQYCGVFIHQLGYNGLFCARTVSVARPDLFASVYNQTLKDMKICLVRAGWTQVGADQGACLPRGKLQGQCVRTFQRGYSSVWLYSALDGPAYQIGIQTSLGP
jgi:hypothetical protein